MAKLRKASNISIRWNQPKILLIVIAFLLKGILMAFWAISYYICS
ncbi:MAG: hypothetical protein ACFFAG_04655 [Promethearchaeota archaeon]